MRLQLKAGDTIVPTEQALSHRWPFWYANSKRKALRLHFFVAGWYRKTWSAAWHGTRIILRQVSPESSSIFDFILELFRTYAGDWAKLAAEAKVSMTDLRHFLEYAAVFLGNVGNYFVGLSIMYICSAKYLVHHRGLETGNLFQEWQGNSWTGSHLSLMLPQSCIERLQRP